jgi:hypothetical protein
VQRAARLDTTIQALSIAARHHGKRGYSRGSNNGNSGSSNSVAIKGEGRTTNFELEERNLSYILVITHLLINCFRHLDSQLLVCWHNFQFYMLTLIKSVFNIG